jgi:DNA-binding transcriptional ArsR family regulator
MAAPSRYMNIDDPRVVKALAHPLRVRLLSLLDDRVASPNELSQELDAPLNTVSYHVRTLASLKLIKLVKKVPRRGALEHFYTAVARPAIDDDTWGRLPTIVKEALLGASLQQIGDEVTQAAAAGGFERNDAQIARMTVTLDEQGWSDLVAETQRLLTRAEEIEDEARARLDRNGATPMRAGLVALQFEGAESATPSDPPPSARTPGRKGRPTRRRASPTASTPPRDRAS